MSGGNFRFRRGEMVLPLRLAALVSATVSVRWIEVLADPARHAIREYPTWYVGVWDILPGIWYVLMRVLDAAISSALGIFSLLMLCVCAASLLVAFQRRGLHWFILKRFAP
jgi:hypothetical protein